jgi:3-hydroxyisobutyrate dehydrogenase-like beta-hydroxyacid dehydrogenase
VGDVRSRWAVTVAGAGGPAVGFAGLGAMGAGIAGRLLRAGFALVVWNRTPAKAEPLLAAGAAWADSPRELAERSEVVFTMLTAARSVEEVAAGEQGLLAGLEPGKTYLDLSTIAPAESRALAERVAETGATMLDAPVSGSIATLEAGEMSVMVGGDRGAFERVRPLLEEIGPKVTYLGPNGSALLMKIAINVSLVVQGMSFCESVAMAEKAGIEREAAVDAALKSVIASPMLAYRGPMILEGRMPETPFADVALQQKDQLLGLQLARELGTPLPFATLANEFLTACRAAGLADKEWIAVYDVFRALGGDA